MYNSIEYKVYSWINNHRDCYNFAQSDHIVSVGEWSNKNNFFNFILVKCQKVSNIVF